MITLEEVLSPENMQTACRRVIANRGAPGVDGMTVNEVRAHFEKHGASICAHIREGRYIPAAVKRVDIPKPNGGTRTGSSNRPSLKSCQSTLILCFRSSVMDSALERVLTRPSSKPRNTSPKGERGLWNWTWPNSSIRSTTID